MPTRSPRPRSSSVSTRTRPSTFRRRPRPRPCAASSAAPSSVRPGRSRLRRVGTGEPDARRCSTALNGTGCPTAGPTRSPRTRPATRAWRPARRRRGAVALAPILPELWGGSADLAGSNNTTIDGADSFGPSPSPRTTGTPNRTAAPCTSVSVSTRWARSSTGIALHGPTRPYGGTFLVFTDYMRPAVRLAALMKTARIYVWTHDSIGLGEDGPTHQPIEHLAALRDIPNLASSAPVTPTRPRTPGACSSNTTGRSGLAPDPPGHPDPRRHQPPRVSPRADTSLPNVQRRPRGRPDRHRFGTAARRRRPRSARGRGRAHPGRVDAVPRLVRRAGPGLPRLGHPARGQGPRLVEAGIAISWYRLLGDAGEAVSLEHFGASADGQDPVPRVRHHRRSDVSRRAARALARQE